MNFNKVLLIGNLTKDPELRYTQSGEPVCSFTLAVNKTWKKDGKEHKDVLFIKVTTWRKQAENCAEYLKKGSPVFIEGELKENRWTDKETNAKRSKIEVTASRVQFLGQKAKGKRRRRKRSRSGKRNRRI